MDLYKILEVSSSASQEEIRKSYRKLARKYHPDSNPNDKNASDRFKEIAEAYAVLGDEDKRTEYDEQRVEKKNRFAGAKAEANGFSGGGVKFSKSDIWNQFFYGGNPFGQNPLDKDKEVEINGEDYGYGADKKSANQQFANFFGFKPFSK